MLDNFDAMLIELENPAFHNAKTAKQFIQPVSLVFLDINMPVVNGLETA